MLVYLRVSHLGGERHREIVLPKNTTQGPRPGIEAVPLDPNSSALTSRTSCLLVDNRVTAKSICFVDKMYHSTNLLPLLSCWRTLSGTEDLLAVHQWDLNLAADQ